MNKLERLRVFRQQAGLTEEEVGALMDMHPSTYHKLETGSLRLRVEHLERLATIYDCSTDELLGRDEGGTDAVVASVSRAVRLYDLVAGNLVPTKTAVHVGVPGLGLDATAVRINDRSMADRFNAGDVFVVNPSTKPEPGDYVLARASTGEHLIRKYVPLHSSDPRGPGYILRPENPDHPEIIEREGGIVLGVLILRHEHLRTSI